MFVSINKKANTFESERIVYRFSKENPNGIMIGISKFCELRLKNYITVGSLGSHSVCICKIHQNVKLIISALPLIDKVTYHNILEKLVCSTESKLCMLHRCKNCPGTSALQYYYIESKLELSFTLNAEWYFFANSLD